MSLLIAGVLALASAAGGSQRSADALQLFVSARHAVSGFVAGHLYVGWADPLYTKSPVFRYKIHQGVPEKNPDLRYPGVFWPQFTVARDGSLFGIGRDRNLNWNVNVFSWNSNRRQRRLQLPTPVVDTYYTGLAVDAAGYIYTDFAYSASPLGTPSCQSPSGPGLGILVYPPGAKGHASFVTCFGVNEDWSVYEGIALDSLGSLYVPCGVGCNAVEVYGTPIKNPMLIRSVTGASIQQPTSIALDANDRMWVLNANRYGSSYVANYRKYASGDVRPEEVVEYPTRQHWYGNIAVDDAFLYIGGNGQVLIYDKCTNGRRTPLAVLDVPNAANGNGPWIAIGR